MSPESSGVLAMEGRPYAIRTCSSVIPSETIPRRIFSNSAAVAVGAKLAVVGYADISGSTEYNIKLSQQRAEAVAEILRANGAEVAVVTGNGETEEYKDRFLNRRVIIKVYEE